MAEDEGWTTSTTVITGEVQHKVEYLGKVYGVPADLAKDWVSMGATWNKLVLAGKAYAEQHPETDPNLLNLEPSESSKPDPVAEVDDLLALARAAWMKSESTNLSMSTRNFHQQRAATAATLAHALMLRRDWDE